MAVEHTTVLALLGKNISFTVSLNLPSDLPADFFNKSGVVQSVVIDLEGAHGIFVGGEYYFLSEIDVTLTA